MLCFNTAKITKKFTVGEDDFQRPNFLGKIKTNVAKYHQNYHRGYTPAKMHDRINSLLKRKSKLTEVAEPSHSLRCSSLSTLRSSGGPTNFVSVTCGEFGKIRCLHAAGVPNATNKKLNVEHT